MFNRRGWLVASLSLTAAGLLSAAGCSMVATAMYVITGNDAPAECDELKGKKVAVVCRPTTSLDFNNSSVADMLAHQVSTLLGKNVSKVTIIDPRKVGDWTDENTWEDYVEIGKALNADYVVGIDLEEFSLQQGQTLFQGRASIAVSAYDVKKGKLPIWEKHLPQSVYPPSGGIPAGEKPESQFRRQFVSVLADQIARHFYPHDATADFAQDSTVLN
jgi:hypothetical protein